MGQANTGPARHLWTSPRRLQTALALLWLVTALFLWAALAGAHQHRQALQTIGRDAAPSIIGAQRIKAGLSDMDAAAADVLLLPPGIEQEQADDHYERRRVEVTENLARAAQNVNYGEAERQPLRTLADALGTYETDVAQARLLHLRGEMGSRLVYRMTHSEMHDTLLPAADALNQANDHVLEAAYRHQQVSSGINLVLVWVTGLLLTVILGVTQIYLMRLTRRVFNLPLLGATVVTGVVLFYTAAVFSQESDTLQTVKESAFAAISVLWETRATAFDANSEESRWLMDTPQAPQYEQLFYAQSGHVTDLTAKLNTDHFGGEQSHAQEMVQAYGVFGGTDRRLRALENGGNHAGAVALCVGQQPGQHLWAFTQFDDALGRTLDIDQGAFDSAVAAGARQQAGYEILAALAGLAVALLTGIGLRVRLREYAP